MDRSLDILKILDEGLESILKFNRQTHQRKFELNKALSEIDLELEDVYHFIEFANFNASEGYNLAKEVKNLRLKRREIKNELEILMSCYDKFETLMGGQKKASKVRSGMKENLDNIDNKGYRPRVRVDLFDKIKDKVNILD